MDCWDIFDNCRAFVQNGIRRFFSFSHIWIVLFLVFSAFSNLYYFCWLELISPTPASLFTPDPSLASNRVLGLSLLVISAFLKAIWVGAWVQTMVITWFCDGKWRPPRSSKNIMQVEPSNWDDARESERVHGFLTTKTAAHGAAVYLRTIKAYLFVLVFLPLDAVFSIAIAIYALARYQLRFAPFAISVIVAALVVVGGVAFFTRDKFWLLACKNCVYHESSDTIGGSGFSSGGNPNVFPGMVVTLIEIFPTPIGLLDIGRTFSWLRLSTLLLTLLAPIQATGRPHRIIINNRSTAVSGSARAALRHTMLKGLLLLLPTLDGVDSSSQEASIDLDQRLAH
ncbi:hypothetical protein DL769_000881 [Monosporascus sp. CRB-8-3]|nr:hypothetical protein DL769_000881 [Monosporascus sp. CRB-8-3]